MEGPFFNNVRLWKEAVTQLATDFAVQLRNALS